MRAPEGGWSGGCGSFCGGGAAALRAVGVKERAGELCFARMSGAAGKRATEDRQSRLGGGMSGHGRSRPEEKVGCRGSPSGGAAAWPVSCLAKCEVHFPPLLCSWEQLHIVSCRARWAPLEHIPGQAALLLCVAMASETAEQAFRGCY